MMKFMPAFWSWDNESFLQFPKDMARVGQWRNYYYFHNRNPYEFNDDYLFTDCSCCQNTSPSYEQNTAFKFQALQLTLSADRTRLQLTITTSSLF